MRFFLFSILALALAPCALAQNPGSASPETDPLLEELSSKVGQLHDVATRTVRSLETFHFLADLTHQLGDPDSPLSKITAEQSRLGERVHLGPAELEALVSRVNDTARDSEGTGKI